MGKRCLWGFGEVFWGKLAPICDESVESFKPCRIRCSWGCGEPLPPAVPLGGAAPSRQEQRNLPGEWEIFNRLGLHQPCFHRRKTNPGKKLSKICSPKQARAVFRGRVAKASRVTPPSQDALLFQQSS